MVAGKIGCRRRSVWNGEEVTVKSKRGYRVVNIEPALCAMLKGHLNGRTAGCVFQTSRGTPNCKSNVRRKLLSILTKLGLPAEGLHAFRNGRVSVLQMSGVPADLVREWVGHSSLRTTSRYTHLADDFRRRVAANVALFVDGNVASQLPVGPDRPNIALVAGSAGGM